jgi:hypothetical protein
MAKTKAKRPRPCPAHTRHAWAVLVTRDGREDFIGCRSLGYPLVHLSRARAREQAAVVEQPARVVRVTVRVTVEGSR